MSRNIYVLSAFSLFWLFITLSCKKEDDTRTIPDNGYRGGIYIVNESPFLTGTGTVDYLNRKMIKFEDLYPASNNGQVLGNLVNSIQVIGSETYIVVNNANKIEIVDSKTFTKTGTIDNLPSPRYIVQGDESSAFISCWGDSSVKVINLQSNAIIHSFKLNGPEKMAKIDDKLWVLSQGGLSVDSVILVIDIPSISVVKTLQVYPQPSGIQTDKNENVWVICSGRNSWHPGGESKGHLICFSPDDYSILKDIEFPLLSSHPEELIIGGTGDVMFYRYPGGIFKIGIEANEPENLPFIARANGFYSLAYDEIEDAVYGSDPLNYQQNGWIYKYRADSGAVIDSIGAGLIPGEIYIMPGLKF